MRLALPLFVIFTAVAAVPSRADMIIPDDLKNVGQANTTAADVGRELDGAAPETSPGCIKMREKITAFYADILAKARNHNLCKLSKTTHADAKFQQEKNPYATDYFATVRDSACIYTHKLVETDITYVEKTLDKACDEVGTAENLPRHYDNCLAAETPEDKIKCLRQLPCEGKNYQACVPKESAVHLKAAAKMMKDAADHLRASAVDESLARAANGHVIGAWSGHLLLVAGTFDRLVVDMGAKAKLMEAPDKDFFTSPRSHADTLGAFNLMGDTSLPPPVASIKTRADELARFARFVQEYKDPVNYAGTNNPGAFPELGHLGGFVQEQATALQIAQSMRQASEPLASKVDKLAKGLENNANEMIARSNRMGDPAEVPNSKKPEFTVEPPGDTSTNPGSKKVTGASRPMAPDGPSAAPAPAPPANPVNPPKAPVADVPQPPAPRTADASPDPVDEPGPADPAPSESSPGLPSSPEPVAASGGERSPSGGSKETARADGMGAPRSTISSGKSDSAKPAGRAAGEVKPDPQEVAAKDSSGVTVAKAPPSAAGGEQPAAAPNGEPNGTPAGAAEEAAVARAPARLMPDRKDDFVSIAAAKADSKPAATARTAKAAKGGEEAATAPAARAPASARGDSLRDALARSLAQKDPAARAQGAAAKPDARGAAPAIAGDDAVTGELPPAKTAAFSMNASETEAEVRRHLSGTGNEPGVLGAESPALFERVHHVHERSLRSGKVTLHKEVAGNF